MELARARIDGILPKIVELRRDLHAHPELAYREERTAGKIAEILSAVPGMNIKTRVAKTGIVATLADDKSGPCVALRADMDALPITEETGVSYASTTPGVMHACGHDGHTAALVGAALVLGSIPSELRGPVKFIFQPAEEGGAGARAMCAEGALDNPKVDAIFGLHGWPQAKVGTINYRAGSFMAASDNFVITVRGKGSHAATPHLGVDPILIASHIVVAIQSVVARNLNPLENGVITIGEFHAGSQRNIISDTAHLSGTIRSLDPTTRVTLKERFEKIVTGTATTFGGEATIEYGTNGYPTVVNDLKALTLLEKILPTIPYPYSVDSNYSPVFGAEDFAFYLERIPGAFCFLGLRPPTVASIPTLHNSHFDFNDDVLRLGIATHVAIALGFADIWADL